MPTVRALLQRSSLPRLEARMLLQHVLQVPRAWLLAHDTDALEPEQIDRFMRLQQQRNEGVPMAYIVGRREFMGLEFLVGPQVLIPRPETELLVETALEQLEHLKAASVLDLGTGSGAIAVALASLRPDLQVYATDASEEALAVARDNAIRHGVNVQFLLGDWYDALDNSDESVAKTFDIDGCLPAEPLPPKFDLIVSNPPYIAKADPHLQEGDIRYEPSQALTDGGDGLTHLRTIIQRAGGWLKEGGALWVEHGWDQAAAVRQLFRDAGFRSVQSRQDLARIERISGGSL